MEQIEEMAKRKEVCDFEDIEVRARPNLFGFPYCVLFHLLGSKKGHNELFIECQICRLDSDKRGVTFPEDSTKTEQDWFA